MFETFTDRGRRVVVLAQEEARLLNHNYIGTEHLLLGLVHEDEGLAADALGSLGISLERARQQVEIAVGAGDHAPSGHIPFTARAKKVLELSMREAKQLGHRFIGTEHLLLGLIREGEGTGAQTLIALGVPLEAARARVIELLKADPESSSPDWSERISKAFGARSSRRGRTERGWDRSMGPTCTDCGSPLEESLALTAIDVGGDGATESLSIAFCGDCGATFSVFRPDQ